MSKLLERQDKGFTIKSLMGEGQPVMVARFHCVECGATSDIKISSDTRINCEAYAKIMTRRGWQAWPHKTSKTYCPDCLGPRSKRSLPDLKVVPMALPATASKPMEVRKPTPDERMKIRGLLDKHFDDAKGMYLDGKSDHILAEELNVPRLLVEQIREVGYGPIKVDTELVQIQEEIEALKADLVRVQRNVEERIVALERRLDQRVSRAA